MSQKTPNKNLPNNVPSELAEAIKDLPKDKKIQITAVFQQSATSYRGPLPPPEFLKAFNEIIPDGAERIMKTYEAQVSHRHREESFHSNREFITRTVGQVFAFLITMTAFSIAIFAITKGFPMEGIATAIASIAALVGLFIYERNQKKS